MYIVIYTYICIPLIYTVMLTIMYINPTFPFPPFFAKQVSVSSERRAVFQAALNTAFKSSATKDCLTRSAVVAGVNSAGSYFSQAEISFLLQV